jgi:sulfur relay (sulfurtransferase) complex TusBCD TusD component (DsrE family)
MKALLIVNDTPLQGQRCSAGLDLASALLRTDGTEVSVFLVGAAVTCTIAGPTGNGQTEDAARAVTRLISTGADVRVCAASLSEHDIDVADLLIGVVPGSSADLAALALEADRLLVF